MQALPLVVLHQCMLLSTPRADCSEAAACDADREDGGHAAAGVHHDGGGRALPVLQGAKGESRRCS